MALGIKICGITDVEELDLLARGPVALCGLWHATGGKRELRRERLATLAAEARARAIEPCLVTLASGAAEIVPALLEAGIRLLQLHGFCLPPAVAKIRRAIEATGGEARILKVLHVAQGRCLEEGLIEAYRQCGADGFILDTFAGRGRIGSTGVALEAPVADALARRIAPHPVWLAGGVDADRLARRGPLCPFAGFDIDSAARRGDRIDGQAMAALFAALEGIRHVA